MTAFSPCRRCAHRSDCGRLAGLRQTLRSTSITSAGVKCGIPAADFPPGTRVDVAIFTLAFGEDADDGYCRHKTVRTGTVRTWRGMKCGVLLDVGQEVGGPDEGDVKHAIVRVYHDQITARTEERRSLCACGLTADRCADPAKQPKIKGADWGCYEAQARSWGGGGR